MEEIGELIGKGFGIWRSNLNLCIPFLLSIFLSMIISLPFLAAFFMTSMPMASMNATLLQNDEYMQELMAQMQGSLDSLEMDKILPIAVTLLGAGRSIVFGQCILHSRGHRHGQAGSG